MLIAVDGDGVLFDMLGAINIRNPKFNPSGVVDYEFETETYGIPRDEVLRMFGEYETFKRQKLYRGAKEGVTQLLSLGEVIGYTAVPEDCIDIRRHQYKKVGIYRANIYTTDEKPVIDVDVLVEDCLDVVKKYEGTDTLCFIIDRPYNRGYSAPNVIRAKNVMEVAGKLKKLNKTLKKY